MDTHLDGHFPPERVRERLPVAFPVMLEADDHSPRFGRVANLSGTGLFVATRSPLSAGTTVRLSLALPFASGAQPLAALAEVRWVNDPDRPLSTSVPPGMGLQFVKLDAPGRACLHAFLAELLDGPAGRP